MLHQHAAEFHILWYVALDHLYHLFGLSNFGSKPHERFYFYHRLLIVCDLQALYFWKGPYILYIKRAMRFV